MSLLTHLLAALFGAGSWISVNGLWVELPLMVPQVPEGWYLPSYLSVLIQMANIGPICVTLMHRFRPGALSETAVIYGVIVLGAAASFLLGFLWKETVVVAGAPRSVALLVLTFLLSAVDCTSSVTFLPFMMHLQPQFLTSYYIGEGLSGLFPALLALVQGVGQVTCGNSSRSGNHSLNSSSSLGTGDLQAQYESPRFSAEVFFFLLSAMMLVCLLAFVLLNHHPSVAREMGNIGREMGNIGREPGNSRYTSGVREKARGRQHSNLRCLMGSFRGAQQKSRFGTGTYTGLQVFYIFGILAWANALTNAVLPSVQSYSCMPYGNHIYHLSAIMAASSNPLACFIALFFPIRSVKIVCCRVL